MKKIWFFLWILAFIFNFSFTQAKETSQESSHISLLLEHLENTIKENPELLDHYLIKLQYLNQQQELKLQNALKEGKLDYADELTRNRDFIRQVNSHLYKKKEEKSQKKIESWGISYHFRSQSFMPWLSMNWGEEEYFTFPSKQAYIQLNWNHNTSGEVKNLISVDYQGLNYLPKYYYAGNFSLQDLNQKEKGDTMGWNMGNEQESYLFFDLPLKEEKEMKKLTFKLWNTEIKGDKLFITPAFSPFYTKKEMSPGFKYCKAVAERKGERVETKEYLEQDCEAAAKLQFSPSLHPDILDYAKHLYWGK